MSKIDITIRDNREVHIITSMDSYTFDIVIKRYFDLHFFSIISPRYALFRLSTLSESATPKWVLYGRLYAYLRFTL